MRLLLPIGSSARTRQVFLGTSNWPVQSLHFLLGNFLLGNFVWAMRTNTVKDQPMIFKHRSELAGDVTATVVASNDRLNCRVARRCITLDVSRGFKSTDIIDRLSELFVMYGMPRHIRSDNGPEFIAKAIRGWLSKLGVKTLYVEPGSPWEKRLHRELQ